jgi:Uma2 family endonuclease
MGLCASQLRLQWDHQLIVGRLFRQLDDHVTRLGLGRVGLSPLDVVLDEARHLVVQPDLVFVAEERVHIIRDRIWGAPDLVVEVRLSCYNVRVCPPSTSTMAPWQ